MTDEEADRLCPLASKMSTAVGKEFGRLTEAGMRVGELIGSLLGLVVTGLVIVPVGLVVFILVMIVAVGELLRAHARQELKA